MAGLPGPTPADGCALEAGPGPQAGGPGAQPFLRWAGSKRKLVARLSKYWSDRYARYVEPFAGSACLFFQLAPARAILGDINQDLIETFEQVRENTSGVLSALARLRKGKAHFLRVRGVEPATLAPAERAARFIYLNRYCFNGLYRTNRSGTFNVPYGGKKSGLLPSERTLSQCATLLKQAELVPGDFETVLTRIEPGDFVYLDPPFSVRARRVFREYGPSVFGQADVLRLKRWLTVLDERGAAFLVSYADSAEARQLAGEYYVRAAAVQRNIAGFTKSRVRARELLISNKAPTP
jgi:DNA adenine methylase